jgi:hypothetical protein
MYTSLSVRRLATYGWKLDHYTRQNNNSSNINRDKMSPPIKEMASIALRHEVFLNGK